MLESPETTSGGDSDSKTTVLLAIKFGSQVLTRHTLQCLEEVSPLWATSVRGRYKCISESFVSHQRPGLHLPKWGYRGIIGEGVCPVAGTLGNKSQCLYLRGAPDGDARALLCGALRTLSLMHFFKRCFLSSHAS